MKIWILVISHIGTIERKQEFLTKEVCERQIKEDEWGKWYVGCCREEKYNHIYSSHINLYDRDEIWKVRAKRMNWPKKNTEMHIQHIGVEFQCVESSL